MAGLAQLRSTLAIRTRLRRAAFDARWASRVRRRRHAIVLGDSHSATFTGWRLPGWWFDVTTVGGATASGIRNPNSVTEALPTFRRRLRRARGWQPILVMLGEVDCGYIIWRRARTDGVSVSDSLEQTVRRYEDFLRVEVAPCGPVMVMSAPLPTLPDDFSTWGEVARRRADVQVSQRDRTELTLRFNERLAAICDRAGWTFVEATRAQLDPVSGLVRSELVRHGTGDHHLVTPLYRALVARALVQRVPAASASAR